jgi:hypothetical protein
VADLGVDEVRSPQGARVLQDGRARLRCVLAAGEVLDEDRGVEYRHY